MDASVTATFAEADEFASDPDGCNGNHGEGQYVGYNFLAAVVHIFPDVNKSL